MTNPTRTDTTGLSTRQRALGPIAAHAASGDIDKLDVALEAGLDAGLSVSEVKEALVQLYAYAGFPRSLNALTALMKVLDARHRRGVRDVVGKEAGPVPSGAELLAIGTANQTRLSGAPVAGPLFEFAPAIDQFLKAHLFGDIFARDNLDWPSRELVTVAILSSLSGADSQLASHLRISMNVGITAGQLNEFADELAAQGPPSAADRLRAALQKQSQAAVPMPSKTDTATTAAAPVEPPMVRIAELEIDPAQLDAYKLMLKEQQEAAVRLEPGVLMLHSVAITNDPTRIRLLEVYAGRCAYESHLKTPHFVKYKTGTASMVKALPLIDSTPVLLCAKSGGQSGGPLTCK